MKKKIFITFTTILAFSFCSITAFAENVPQPPNQIFSEIFSSLDSNKLISIYKEVLDEEVINGNLTQAEADEKYQAMQNGERPEKPERQELSDEDRLAQFKERLNKQVEEGKLSQTEADEKYQAMQKGDIPNRGKTPPEESKAFYKKVLDKLVSNGTMTQTEADEKYNLLETAQNQKTKKSKENN